MMRCRKLQKKNKDIHFVPFYVMGAREEWIEGGPGGLGLSQGFWGDGNWGRERRGGGG